MVSIIILLCVATAINAQKRIVPTLYEQTDQVKMTQWVDSVFNTMSTDDKIGQLFAVMIAGDVSQANKNSIISQVKNQRVGGILFSKGTVENQAELTNLAQKNARVPLMISLDGEWGLSMRLKNTTLFPRNMMLGAITNDSLLYYYGLEVARQCKEMGIHVNFAPAIDVNSNPKNPVIGNRSFGEDPKLVARLGIMYSKGLEAGGVMSVSKHFPGHGDTSTDSHKTLPIIEHDRSRLDSVELYPFVKYVEAKLSGVMIGHLDVPALEPKRIPSSLSYAITTELLENEMGFTGLRFTDGLQMKGVSNVENHCVKALLAGSDVLLGPINIVKQFKAVKQAVEDGVISDSLLNVKCRKVLEYKYVLGVHNVSAINEVGLSKRLNSPNAEYINRQLNAAAITLLKNKKDLLPLEELDERKIAAVSIGVVVNNTFQKTLKKYASVDCFNVTDSNSMAYLVKKLAKYNTVIVSVHGDKAVPMSEGVRAICKDKSSVLVYFGNPYKLKNYSFAVNNVKSVIMGYENTRLAQEYAAQAIFGGIEINGTLPVSIDGLFDLGEGIVKKKSRLRYDVPEFVGINSSRLDSIQRIVEEGIAAKAFPGCQVLIAKDGVVVYERAFGTFEYNKNDSVTTESVYDLASMSKASGTLPAVMKLYDKGKFSLNDPISKFVDEFKGGDKTKISIRDALLHESRLPSFIPYYMSAIDTSSYQGKLIVSKYDPEHPVQYDNNTWTRRDYKYKSDIISDNQEKDFIPLAEGLYINKSYQDTIIKNIANTKLARRKKYNYSCLNFIMLQQVVEKVSKKDLNSFLQKNFFHKLGSVTTTYQPLNTQKIENIVPTEQDGFLRKQLVRGYVHDEGAAFMGGISGNAGLFSNANDLAKLYQMLLNDGVYGGERYLSEKTCRIFTRTKSGISRRGLGWDKPEGRVGKYSPCSYSTPVSTYGHTGFTGTCFWIDPDNNIIYIFLSNRVSETRMNRAMSELNIRERIQEEIYKAMK